MDQKVIEFARLVRTMRAAQQNYFSTRDRIVLDQARKLEREVDDRLNGLDQKSEFVRLVRTMRAAQRNYFRTRDRAVLEQSRKLEREVDNRSNELIRMPGFSAAPTQRGLWSDVGDN